MTRYSRMLLVALQRIFGPHKLPGILTVLALLIIVTDAAFTLIGQPPIYWQNHRYVNEYNPLTKYILAAGPTLFGVVVLVYLVVVGVLLATLAYSPALVLWMAICIGHLSEQVRWLPVILRDRLKWSHNAINLAFYAYLGLLAVVLGAALSRTLLPRRKSPTDVDRVGG
jgi:hypothetical protein